MARKGFIQVCIGIVMEGLRVRAGYPERAAAARLLRTTPGKLRRLEDGENDSVEPGLVENWAGKLGASQEEQERLAEWAALTRDPGANTSLAGFRSGYIFFQYLERLARVIWIYDPELITGLAQVEAYTRDLVEASPGGGQSSADETVEGRRRRQKGAFEDGNLTQLIIIVTQACLDSIKDKPYYRAQIERLRELDRLPNVEVYVIGHGLHPSIGGPYTYMEFEPGFLPSVVYLETQAGGIWESEAKAVQVYPRLFTATIAQAVKMEEARC